MAQCPIFAYYYPWYTGLDNARRFSQFRDFPPALGFYRSDDARVIDQHLAWSQAYGLDGFLVEWYGVPTAEGVLIDRSLGIMRARLGNYPDFRYAVFYDQAIRFFDLTFGDPGKREDFLKDMEKLAADNFSHPNYWFIGGRPVVVIYLTRSANPGYGSLLQAARQRMNRVSGCDPYIIGDEVWWSRRMDNIDFLDAVTAYNLHNNDALQKSGGHSREFVDFCVPLYQDMQRQAQKTNTGLIAGIGHAYNDEGGRGNLPILPTWEDGSLPEYRQDMVYALSRIADVYTKKNPLVGQFGLAPIFVTSFNEWMERSNIEPSAEIEAFNELYDFPNERVLRLPAYGFQYLQGLREGKQLAAAKLADL